MGLGFGVLGLGFGVWGLGFRVWGLGFRVLYTVLICDFCAACTGSFTLDILT